MRLTRREFTRGLAMTGAFVGLGSERARAQDITAAEARAIAKEAYVYGFPLVDSYRVEYAYFVNKKDPEYKAPWNQLHNTPRVYTPADTAIQTPNSDTPYSMIGMDLRAEPIVLTVPKIEKDRYFSIQLIDAYTFNFDYIGSRTTGNDGGSFLVAGPNWQGKTPDGIAKVFRSETELVLGVYRTQLFDPEDIENVKKIQDGYRRSRSSFLKTAAPPPAPAIDFIKPLSVEDERRSLAFFNILNFVLQFCPTNPSETELMTRFARIGVGGGKTIDVATLPPAIKTAMEQGIVDAWVDFEGIKKQFDAGTVTSGDVFGTRKYLKNNYLYRMAAAVLGIYGNSKQEAIYPAYAIDSQGNKLTGSSSYTIRFAAGELPPVHAFWSLTMYEMPKSLLVANPINRYLLNKPMLPHFVKGADGSYTFYIQNQSPGKDKEPNWLPAPKGGFFIALRLYWPEEAALDGAWRHPPIVKTQ